MSTRENTEGQRGYRKREGARTRERRGKGGHKQTREEREGRERGQRERASISSNNDL